MYIFYIFTRYNNIIAIIMSYKLIKIYDRCLTINEINNFILLTLKQIIYFYIC